jgi:hypothetical protein
MDLDYLKRQRQGRAKWVNDLLHNCSVCGREGFRPGILAARGMEDRRALPFLKKYEELSLDQSGICESCSKASDIQHILDKKDV